VHRRLQLRLRKEYRGSLLDTLALLLLLLLLLLLMEERVPAGKRVL
jgi:hypothetical protein